MVVVVIIGILAAVAIPAYTGFQKKAKSAGAKVQLSGIYTAEKAYFAEQNEYTDDLEKAGLEIGVALENYTKIGFSTGGANGSIGVGAANPAATCKATATTFKACAEKGIPTTPVANESWYITEKKELAQY